MHAAPASGFPWTLQLDKWARSATATCNLGRTRVGLRRVSRFAVTSHLPAALIVNFVTEPLCCALVGLHLYISSLKLSKCSRLRTFFFLKKSTIVYFIQPYLLTYLFQHRLNILYRIFNLWFHLYHLFWLRIWLRD